MGLYTCVFAPSSLRSSRVTVLDSSLSVSDDARTLYFGHWGRDHVPDGLVRIATGLFGGGSRSMARAAISMKRALAARTSNGWRGKARAVFEWIDAQP